MTTRHGTRLFALGVAVLCAIAVAPPVANAQQARERPRHERRPARAAPAVDEVKRRCLNQIERRHRALAATKRRLADARFVTDDHEGALAQNIDATAASLSRLADVIQGEDNFDELRAECHRIVDDHRVFVLVLPRARLVAAADGELAAATRLTAVADKLQARIDHARGQGKDVTAAQADLASMRSHIQSTGDRVGGVFGSAMPIAPADYNANHEVLSGARGAVHAGRDELRAAVAAGRATRHDLGEDRSQPS